MEESLTEHALRHLKRTKPYDGWSVDKYTNSAGKKLVMLRRRNAPLSNKTGGYIAIAYDEGDTKCVVGITSRIGEAGKTSFYRGEVLVEKDGAVARDQRTLRLSLKKPQASAADSMEGRLNKMKEQNRKDRENARQAQSVRRGQQQQSGTKNSFSSEDFMKSLSDEQTSELAKLGLIFIGVVTILKIISTFAFAINAVVLPLAILYAMMNCPPNESFEAKKELKRVLRGHHLPEGHENKPADDWLSRTVARVTASVVAEASTAFGYEVSFLSIGGACTLATVVVPSISMELYWIGAFGSWRYIMRKDLPPQQTS